MNHQIEQQKEKIIQELHKLEPYIASHGGTIEFVEFKNNVVFVRLQGTCLQCPLSFYTLKYGLERQLKESISSNIFVETIE